ncbi:hypothetical protein CF386_10275 [Paraphotobacterium marinum]|uniref:Uncharacterized protein n=1 Tax=Paraphotobacterium marinum TaxID=1755811 RepID=A0A220VGS3_9GAMM|nr:hypothetical protein [Paraphotobacterium marinum]ASK79436.1 hypothetical protein CF386_10275 [Paraphotobacterium marinum]
MKNLGSVCKKIIDDCYSDSYSFKKFHKRSEQDNNVIQQNNNELRLYKSNEEISDNFCFQDQKDGISLMFLMIINFIKM